MLIVRCAGATHRFPAEQQTRRRERERVEAAAGRHELELPQTSDLVLTLLDMPLPPCSALTWPMRLKAEGARRSRPT